MKETRICSECNSKMKRNGGYSKGGVIYVYLKCPKCGIRRKLQVTEKIIENFRPKFSHKKKLSTSDPLPES